MDLVGEEEEIEGTKVIFFQLSIAFLLSKWERIERMRNEKRNKGSWQGWGVL
jgi:hypothetical protein